MPIAVVDDVRALVAIMIMNVIVGFIWYSPGVFGGVWMRGLGRSAAEMKQMMKSGAVKSIIVGLIQGLLMGFVLEHAIIYAGATTVAGAAFVAFWNWLGFTAVALLGSVIYERRPWSYYFVNAGYFLVVVLIASYILLKW